VVELMNSDSIAALGRAVQRWLWLLLRQSLGAGGG
jgi:hypothetical protein